MRILRKISIVLAAFLLIMSGLQAHTLPADTTVRKSKVKNQEPLSLLDRGFDFIIGAGIYFGGRYSAGYYSGIPENENNLNYIFDNYYRKQEIVDLIVKNNNFVSRYDSTIAIKEYPAKMRYSPALSISLGLSYKFTKNWGLTFTYSFGRLVAKDVFSVGYQAISGNEHNDYLLYSLVGKENRSFFDLSVRYLFHPSKVVKPFLEFGVQFNYVKVKYFKAIIEDKEFELLDWYRGQNYVPGVDMQKLNVIYGGPGFGFSAAAGLKIVCTKVISVDPIFYISISKLGLKGYNDFDKHSINYGAYIRFVMNDSFFAR